ncbi:MAG: ATP-binding cassette domain-containing protein [Ekhidna sp.]|nr:ATP-binding cassette domain-containing protein [Ekhidna sp.]
MFKVLSFFFKASWKTIVLAAVASSASALLNLSIYRLLTKLITEPNNRLELQLLLVAGLALCSALISIYIGKQVTLYFETKVNKYRTLLAQRVLGANYQETEKKLERLVPVLMWEVFTIGLFGKSISAVMVAIVQIVAIMGFLFTISWQLSSIIVLLFSVLNVINIIFLDKIKNIEDDFSKTRFMLHVGVDRLEKGLKDLTVNRAHSKKYIYNSIEAVGQKLAEKSLDLFTLRTKIDSFSQLILMVGIACTLSLCIHFFKMEQKVLVEYLALILFLIPSANTLSGFLKNLKKAQNSLEQVEELDVDLRENQIDLRSELNLTKTNNSPLIKLEEVTFSYSNSEGFKIGPVTMDVYQNEILIINGGNGSGKSTIFKLITGLYWPSSGNIYFQSNKITPENIQSYRDYFACYFTDTPVFDDLTYLDQENISKFANELISSLELEGKINLSEVGYVTMPGLSHGQRGRLNLLRLLLQDNEIYFLDEWAANQDVHFKKYFYREIIPALKKQGKTIVLISHDDKYYDVADRIITLKNGQVI